MDAPRLGARKDRPELMAPAVPVRRQVYHKVPAQASRRPGRGRLMNGTAASVKRQGALCVLYVVQALQARLNE